MISQFVWIEFFDLSGADRFIHFSREFIEHRWGPRKKLFPTRLIQHIVEVSGERYIASSSCSFGGSESIF
jgi:hypothetical protein